MERHLSAKRPGLVDLVYTTFGGFYVSEEFRRQQRFLLTLMTVNSYKSYWSKDIVSQQPRPFFASQRISSMRSGH